MNRIPATSDITGAGAGGLTARPHRLRRTAALRDLVAEARWHPGQLVLPLFVREGAAEPRPVDSMPGVVQHTLPSLRKAAREAVDAGVGGLMLFAVPEHKHPLGSGALDPDGILQRAIRETLDEVGDEAVVMSDVCLDEFTDHGHCGVLTPDGRIDNDATVRRYAAMAVLHAEAGVHCVGPSGMMDGQVGAVRRALDDAGHTGVAILAYTAKYASAFYGPFRDAVECDLRGGDRTTYQMDPRDRAGALRALALDQEQGADMVMVKPAMSYLDVVRTVADHADVPVAAYQVSGEYAMVEAAAAHGWIDRKRAIEESLASVRRAGADLVLTYWAVEAARWAGR
ncbi:porphobilinogen synthase [Streptomyces beigongshangae]|uniref:porphobilinogen synthase n=1 Tax=Streptomyces beigongshangae TaxID=2841597 RepID=UPI0027E059F3|nr:porphobilinogen synthase [Streptomyces sp. REN17]